MTQTQHTPGPYYVHLPGGADAGCRTIRTEEGRTHGGYNGTEVAYTPGLRNDDVDKANAHLFAAAPQLLEALEMARREILHPAGGTRALDVSNAAIKAATE